MHQPSHTIQKTITSICFCIVLTTSVLVFWTIPATCGDAKKVKEDRLVIGQFSRGKTEGWEKKIFDGETRYQRVELEGKTVLKGEANSSASGLFKTQRIDLARTPFLNWSWRVDKSHPPLNERTKEGDDYAARVYLVVDGGLLFWRTIALNYVWSSSQPMEATWPNSFAGDNVMLLALRSNTSSRLSTWYREKRNVYEDFKRLFNKEIRYVDAVAIMTDSDNSGGEVLAYYGDIYFSAE